MSLQEKLQQLFLLDQHIRGIRKRLDQAAARHKTQQAKLGQFRSQRQELASQLKMAQVKSASADNQIKDLQQRIDRLRDQMNNVKSNKEYSAVLIEVNTLKLEKGKLEDAALELMGQVERLQQELQEIEARCQQQEKLAASAHAEVDASQAEIKDQLDELTAKRVAAESQVPAEALAVFNRLAYEHEGEVMAAVVEEDRRSNDYSCGGCYISIPIERVNALMTHLDQIVCCPNCGRILYLDEEFKASMGSK